jgi:hypothetical protein
MSQPVSSLRARNRIKGVRPTAPVKPSVMPAMAVDGADNVDRVVMVGGARYRRDPAPTARGW